MVMICDLKATLLPEERLLGFGLWDHIYGYAYPHADPKLYYQVTVM